MKVELPNLAQLKLHCNAGIMARTHAITMRQMIHRRCLGSNSDIPSLKRPVNRVASSQLSIEDECHKIHACCHSMVAGWLTP